MRWVLSLLLVLAMTGPVSSGHLLVGDGLIVPGSRIGPIRLGMHRSTVQALNRVVACPVLATYDGTGSAIWLVTEWGGECWATNDIQVGLGSLGSILSTFGLPDHVDLDAAYAELDALWVTYNRLGIAFRVLVIRDKLPTMVQAIAVFRISGQPSL